MTQRTQPHSLGRLYSRLTQHPTGLSTDKFLRARVVAGVLLALAVLVTLGSVVFYLLDPHDSGPGSYTFLIRMMILALSLLGCALSRTRYYRWSSYLLVGIIWLGTFGVVIIAHDTISNAAWTLNFSWLAIVVVSYLFSIRNTITLTLFTIACIWLLQLLGMNYPLDGLIYTTMFFVINAIVVLIFTDYRNRLETVRQAALAESERQYRILAENSIDIISRIGPDGRILYVSPACKRLLGYDAGEMIGKTMLDFLHPDDVDGYLTYNQHVVNGHDSIFTLSHRLLHKYTGANIWLETNSRPIRDALSRQLVEVYTTSRDITEHKRAEAQLAHERSLFNVVINNIPDYVYFKDRQSRFTLVNRAAVEGLGCQSADEILGKTDFDFFPREVAQEFYDDEQYLLQTGEPIIDKLEMNRAPNGEARWHSSNKVPIYGVDGRIEGLAGFNRDVTQRRRLEAEMERQRDFALQVMETMGQGLVVTNEQSHIEYVNPAMAQMLGYPPDALINKSVMTFIVPEMIPHAQAMQAIRLNGNINSYETRLIRADSSHFTVQVTSVPRWKDDKVIGAIAVITDLTQQKEIETELARQRDFALQVMENLAQGITVTNAEGRFEYVNPAYARMLGYTPEALMNETPFSLTAPEARSSLEEALRIRKSGAISSYETRLVRADDSQFVAQITGVPRWEDGKVAGSIAVISDLTEQKQIEAILTQARDQAIEASRLKSEFLATMSHEIRTPMNGVIGMSELLLDTNLTAEQREYSNIIMSEANALLAIINDILDFSKIESGRMMIESVDLIIEDVVERVVEFLSPKAREKNVSMMSYIAPEVLFGLRGDVVRVRQVLMNLVSNAIKFTESGEIIVEVMVEDATDTEIRVRFSVSDTGIGLTEQARKRLFRPFTQADGSTTRKYGGTGLGLTISKHLVELMGGEIGVNSVEGRGSTFWFTLPFATSSIEWRRLPVNTTVESRVLIVENSRNQQRILRQYLDGWGIRHRAVGSGSEALSLLDHAALEGDPFNIILLDVVMPDMDGFVLLESIRSHTFIANINVVILSAYDSKELQQRAQALNVQHYLVKPVRQAVLLETLIQVTRGTTQPQDNLVKEDDVLVGSTTLVVSSAVRQAVEQAAKPCILLVDDNPTNAAMASVQLERLGYRSEIATNGLEALERLRQSPQRFQLVLMDCLMPELDGYETTRIIRQREEASGVHIPIIALTANALEGDRERCLESGMDDYISKPVSMTTLRQKLQDWLKPH
jgi:PAS domain S-box-containing protein